MAAEQIVLRCPECGESSSVPRKRTFLGFPQFICPSCTETVVHPLSQAYQVTYTVIALMLLLGTVAYLREGRIPVPGVLALAVIVALAKNHQLGRRLRTVGGDQPSPLIDHPRSAGNSLTAEPAGQWNLGPSLAKVRRKGTIVGVGLFFCALAAAMPPWKARAIVTSVEHITSPPIRSVDTTSWSIPYAPLFDPPDMSPSRWEDALLKAIAEGAGGDASKLQAAILHSKAVRRALEQKARVPYALRESFLNQAGPEYDDDPYTNPFAEGVRIRSSKKAQMDFHLDTERLALHLVVIGFLTVGAAVYWSKTS